MRSVALVLVILTSGSLAAEQKTPPPPPETPHAEFVEEFIRELSALEEIRAQGQKELKGNPDSAFENMVHSGTLFKLELGTDIRTLTRMHLKSPYDTVIPSLTGFYKGEFEIWDRMVVIGKEFIEGPRPGVDFQKLQSEMPELRARLDYLNDSILKASPLIFSTLINVDKANSKNQADHLIITSAERKAMIEEIDDSFGTNADAKNVPSLVAAAGVIKFGLKKDFKSADDPWD